MTKPSYYELLKDPRWKIKRDRIVEAAGRKCEECGNIDCRFNVHHKYYWHNTLPWDYPDECYVCLCEDCHDHRHVILDKIKAVIGGFNVQELNHFLHHVKDYSRTIRDEIEDCEFVNLADVVKEMTDRILKRSLRKAQGHRDG